MSASREKRRRQTLGVDVKYNRRYEKWIADEPPIFLFVRWLRWKKNKPVRTW